MQLFNVMDRSCIHEGNMYLRRTESCVYHTLLVDTESKILKPIQEVFIFKYTDRIENNIVFLIPRTFYIFNMEEETIGDWAT